MAENSLETQESLMTALLLRPSPSLWLLLAHRHRDLSRPPFYLEILRLGQPFSNFSSNSLLSLHIRVCYNAFKRLE